MVTTVLVAVVVAAVFVVEADCKCELVVNPFGNCTERIIDDITTSIVSVREELRRANGFSSCGLPRTPI